VLAVSRAVTAGFTLVEVLVALLVLAIGVLGSAALLSASLRNGRSALLRTHAVNLVEDLAARIRANASAGAAYDSSGYPGLPVRRACSAAGAGAGRNCTPAELAEDDLASWMAAVSSTLPAATAPRMLVRHLSGATAGDPDRYQISVSWQEPGEAQPFECATDLLVLRAQLPR
jgi:type IV pilus assembly protein PilV